MNSILINNFDVELAINQKDRKRLVFGESSLMARYSISAIMSLVIYLVNMVFEFTYAPIFSLMLAQVVFLILGGLFFGLGMRNINDQIEDKKITKRLKASALLQFIMIGVIVSASIIFTIIYQIPFFQSTVPFYDGAWLVFLLYNFQNFIEIPLLAISLLLFGLALRRGKQINLWNTRYPFTTIINLVISSALTFTFLLSLIFQYGGSIFYSVPIVEEPIIWRLVLSNYYEISFHYSPAIYGVFGLITTFDMYLCTRKIFIHV